MKKTVIAAVTGVAIATLIVGCRTETIEATPSSIALSSQEIPAPTEVSTPQVAPPSPPAHTIEPPPAQLSDLAIISGKALTQLDGLAVKGRAPKTGYDREQFGQSWSDDVTVTYGHNGCDTRNDILKRDLSQIKYKGSSRCVIASGTLEDPYTNTVINFVRGQKTSTAVQIDHVVALSNAWQTGAQLLRPDQRRDLANDPRNLMAVDGPTNGAKSDGDAATWLPPNKSYRCTYVAKQIAVKAIYQLWVTPAEKQAMTTLLTGCAKS